MRTYTQLYGCAAACVVVLSATPAVATVTVYTDKAAFQAATGTVKHDFGVKDDGYVGQTYTLGSINFSVLDNLIRYDDAYGSPNIPYLGAFGSKLWVDSADTALGFDFGSFFGEQTVTFTVGGISGSFTSPFRNETTFIGFVGTGPLAIEFSMDAELDTTHVYKLATSTAPEPASWALMLGGFGAIGGVLRSRRRIALSFR